MQFAMAANNQNKINHAVLPDWQTGLIHSAVTATQLR